jgi:uncharacterized membrane protein
MLEILLVVAAFAGWAIAWRGRERLRAIEQRLAAIEHRLGQPVAPSSSNAAMGPPPAVQPEICEPTVAETAEPEPAAQDTEGSPRPDVAVTPPITPAPASAGISSTDFEERFGTRWVVWVGGVALALGGIFLVRYSIEQGLLGPEVRTLLGGLLAAVLIAASEWTRRKEQMSGFAGLPTAHIPSILTAAGTTVAFATVYAAYALYGFVGPSAAFVLLGVVALATLAAALLHGAALAALGLVGAEVTPLLVSTHEPNYWALYLYLAVVTAAAFALARLRMWRWLAVTAIVFGAGWTIPGILDHRTAALAPHIFHVAAGFVLAALMIVAGLAFGPDAERGRIGAVSSGALAAYLLAAAVLVLAQNHDTATLSAFSLLTAAALAIAWRAESAVAAVPAAAALTIIVFLGWAVEREVAHLIAPGGPVAGLADEPAQGRTGRHLVLGAVFAGLFGGVGYAAQGRSERAITGLLWAASSSVAPIAILVALYYRVAGFERSLPFASLALLLSAVNAVAVETLGKREVRPGIASAQAMYAVAACASLALALTFALEKGWLTVALALMAPATAWVHRRRALPMLRWLVAAIVALVIARIGWEPRIVGTDVGATPIINWLLYGYGVPALSFWTAGHLLRQRADDIPARASDAAAILFTVLLAVLQIRHLINDGDIFHDDTCLAEIALQASVGLAMTIGLERLRGRTASIVHNIGAQVIAAGTLAAIMFGLCLAENPLITGEPVGGPVVNLVLLGYGLPAVLAITLALVARATRPMPYRVTAVTVAVGLAILYLSLQIARFYHGPDLTAGSIGDAENYTYSAVWLAFGVVLLLAGIQLRSKPARLCSAAVVFLTIGKVFLLDMADLGGAWRALSFIGLGLVLVGIGWLYQRLLFPRRMA